MLIEHCYRLSISQGFYSSFSHKKKWVTLCQYRQPILGSFVFVYNRNGCWVCFRVIFLSVFQYIKNFPREEKFYGQQDRTPFKIPNNLKNSRGHLNGVLSKFSVFQKCGSRETVYGRPWGAASPFLLASWQDSCVRSVQDHGLRSADQKIQRTSLEQFESESREGILLRKTSKETNHTNSTSKLRKFGHKGKILSGKGTGAERYLNKVETLPRRLYWREKKNNSSVYQKRRIKDKKSFQDKEMRHQKVGWQEKKRKFVIFDN